MLTVLLFGQIYAIADTSAIATYTAKFSEQQGVDCFYFCESTSGQVKELVYNIESNGVKRWISESGEYPMFYQNYATPGASSDFEMMFVSPMRGTVRLQGTVERAPGYIGNSAFGDGVKLSILKNNRVIWSGSIASNQASESYDVSASVTVGDKLHFVVNCGQHNYFDATCWYPTVEYISTDYERDEYDPIYYQKKADELKEIPFSETANGYLADDNIAFVSDQEVMPSDNYSIVKRYKISETGRYRVYAPVTSNSTTGFGNVIRVLRNNEECWKQLLVAGTTSTLDVGIFAEKGDYVDVEVGVNGSAGFNKCKWTCDVSKYIGKLFKSCDTSVGDSYTVEKEYTLSSFIKDTDNVGIYSEKYTKVPMVYNSTSKRWESGVSGEKDYVSETTAGPGITTDAIIDIKLPKTGILKLDGDLKIDSASDGVLTKIYLNDKLLWSNRVGSEQSLRWDDKFDEVYFLNKVNVMAYVQSGDTLTVRFNKWRSDGNDNVDISDIKLKYVTGNVLSETTKWKLKNSTVIDTENGSVYNNGINNGKIEVSIKDGTTYIQKTDLSKVFGDKAADIEKLYPSDDVVPLRAAAEKIGKSLFWSADRIITLYDGISVFYGYPEDGEIRTQLKKGGELFG